MNFIHPTAIIGPNVIIGDGNYIGPFCIIGYPAEHKSFWGKPIGKVSIGSNNVFTGHVTIDAGTDEVTTIGNNCWFLKHSHAGHDAIVGDNVTVSCGAKIGGSARIGNHVNLGLNSCVHQHQNIAEGVMIGMGGIVTKKLKTEPYKTYGGNPAKFLKDNDNHPNYTIFMRDTL